MLDIIYDTLFNNTQYEQWNIEKATNQCVDYSKNQIEFEYNGKSYILKVIEED